MHPIKSFECNQKFEYDMIELLNVLFYTVRVAGIVLKLHCIRYYKKEKQK